MHRLKTLLGTGTLAAAVAAGGMVATTFIASADVACNRYAECWQVGHRYNTYPRELGIHFYGDDWRRSHEHDKRFHWQKDRDDDRGYYSHGEWHSFER